MKTNNELRELLMLDNFKANIKKEFGKVNVQTYNGIHSNELAALTLFDGFLERAIIGLQEIKLNAFDSERKHRMDGSSNLAIHVFISSILFYSKMFRGGKGVKRENINLVEDALFNKNGSVTYDKNGNKQIPQKDRFYIEEFFFHNSKEFISHHNILNLVDKSFVHVDKSELIRTVPYIVLDKKDNPKLLALNCYYEFMTLPTYEDLDEYLNFIFEIKFKLNNKIQLNYISIDNFIESDLYKSAEGVKKYYKDLLIQEEEL